MDSELNRTMDGQIPNPPNVGQTQQTPSGGLISSPIPQNETLKEKRGRKPIYTSTTYCENFWEEQSKDVKTGLGFQINSLSDTSARFIFSFCERTKESNLYSWKSSAAEFAKSGVE